MNSLRHGRTLVLAIAICGGLAAAPAGNMRAALAAASPSGMTFTTPPMTLVDLPATAMPPAASSPIVVPSDAGHVTNVKGGDTVTTPCFTTVVPLDSIVTIQGCAAEFAYPTDGPGSEPDDYYAKAAIVPIQRDSLDDLKTRVLAGLKERNKGSAGSSAYGDDDGDYVGSQTTTMFGNPALVLAWGLDTSGPNITKHTTHIAPDGTKHDVISHRDENETLEIFQLLPHDRYVSDGTPLSTVILKGNSIGFEAQSFAYVVAHFALR